MGLTRGGRLAPLHPFKRAWHLARQGAHEAHCLVLEIGGRVEHRRAATVDFCSIVVFHQLRTSARRAAITSALLIAIPATHQGLKKRPKRRRDSDPATNPAMGHHCRLIK